MYGSLIGTAEGATASLPLWKLLWEARPVCQSWKEDHSRPFHARRSSCASNSFGHLVGVDASASRSSRCASSEIVVASVMSRPAELDGAGE